MPVRKSSIVLDFNLHFWFFWNVIRAGKFHPLHLHEDLEEEDGVVNPEDRDSVRDEVVQPERERDDCGLQASVFSTLQGFVV